MRVKKGILVIMVTVLFASSSTWAQQSSTRMVKRHVATVLFSTLGGAILGLSTLPFYGEPQEHTDNITAGAFIGFLAGAGYATYSASKPDVVPRNDYGFGESFQIKKAHAMNAKAFSLVQLNLEF